MKMINQGHNDALAALMRQARDPDEGSGPILDRANWIVENAKSLSWQDTGILFQALSRSGENRDKPLAGQVAGHLLAGNHPLFERSLSMAQRSWHLGAVERMVAEGILNDTHAGMLGMRRLHVLRRMAEQNANQNGEGGLLSLARRATLAGQAGRRRRPISQAPGRRTI